ncbi:ABC transporter ATP-binding protein [Bosea sp. (in: a-proteobacteria)]|uniref:ABC transporter ATP-binding protein n=1 Tax=Bosea sp. (in: a-proteobacteria) TaxID=1871050 RepID=UPI00261CBF6D|nr:ABC transporter ATP-binding protein [Bosea sp. (in: a-proteobacteria)]MCO5091695.1 ABC transporter ATP-binding protein [Bosea sp. (in: a-proteobacteria)]
MTRTSYLTLDNIYKSYDGLTNAVEDVSIDIRKGEFISFLGPSGSGKTTTLMMIAGFEEPSHGGIMLAGNDLTRTKPWRRNIGMVFQNYALFPHLNVIANVGFPLKMRKRPPAEIAERVKRTLDMVGLSSFAHRLPRELSGGQQQRVALARGLVFDPDVLLLDEPLGALDKNLREHMQFEIKRIHQELGVTMIYVTHDQTEAMSMSDRVAVFNKGRIEHLADPLEIYRYPSTKFVGEFLGDSNFFTGGLAADGTFSADTIGTVRITPAERARVIASRIELLVRPEQLQLIEPGQKDEFNSFDATVRSTVNYGDSLLIMAGLAGQALRLRVRGESQVPAVGSTIRIGFRPEAGRIVPAHP